MAQAKCVAVLLIAALGLVGWYQTLKPRVYRNWATDAAQGAVSRTQGSHVMFSVEIRREQGEIFNEIGGFFRQFELDLMAATERDTVRLRTDMRNEVVCGLAGTLKADLPLRQSLILSGQLPQYLAELGVLVRDGTEEDRLAGVLLSSRLLAAYPNLSVSQAMRVHMR